MTYFTVIVRLRPMVVEFDIIQDVFSTLYTKDIPVRPYEVLKGPIL